VYFAIVTGHLKPEMAIIDMPIERSPAKPQTFHTSPSGKAARTKYTVEKSLNGYDVVRLEPETGRTHQLRVHLQQIGHPIVGDHLYNGGEADRLYLHASSLEITLPNGERKVFVSQLPPEFKAFEDKHA
jgi:23S rRNA pseudouridine1911/1915/1917 synthase